ncbi:Hint domain-containing protein [Parasulfitobacter algicola]|uniref:Hint domain-containing protein n=1 Tax=Parasulfitobacter algicola TaxID=2614809 RepID=A0ABX2IZS7_9RHOB|nr:Hint domain-containing protein [Sulfitobacter algicola]NSX55898.1 Hint domain-containing protein [Sulfitobacter algicola]
MHMSKIELTSNRLLPGLSSDAQVRTPCGPRRIEFIRPGDLIITRDRGLQPVRMVWSYCLEDVQHPTEKPRVPVCLNTRAIGPMMPSRSLVLAPDHKVLVPSYLVASSVTDQGSLLAASGLAGCSKDAFYDNSKTKIEFYNLVFDCHEIIFANGLPVETFHPTVEALSHVDEDARREIQARFPILKKKKDPFPAADYQTIAASDYLPAYA